MLVSAENWECSLLEFYTSRLRYMLDGRGRSDLSGDIGSIVKEETLAWEINIESILTAGTMVCF